MVEPMWSMLCQICKLLPNYFSLYVTSFFSLEVNFGMVPIKHVFALLGYLDCGVLWGRLGIDVPDLNRIRDSGLDLLPFNYVLFAVCRFADRSIDCKELVISWVDVIANMIDVGGFGGKLVTSIPQLPLPESSRVNTKLAVRSDDKFLLSAYRFLGKNSGFAAQLSRGDEILLKEPLLFAQLWASLSPAL